MLTYIAPRQIHHLSKRLELLKENRNVKHLNEKEDKANTEWRLYELLAELIFNSSANSRIATKEALNAFYEEYPDKNTLSLPDMFSKQWLRLIMDRVEIPSGIYTCLRDIDKSEPKYIELLISLENALKSSPNGLMSKADIEIFIDTFNKVHPSHSVTFSEVTSNIVGPTLRNDFYSLTAYSQYRLFLKRNEAQFKFLKCFLKKFSLGHIDCYHIPKDEASLIIDRHRKLYSKCPTLESFIETGFLQDDEANVIIRHSYGEHQGRFSISDQTAAYLWEKIHLNSIKRSSLEKVNSWLDKLVINQMFPSHCLNYMSQSAKDALINIAQEVLLAEPDIAESGQELNKLRLDERFGGRAFEHFLYPIKDKFHELQSPAEKYRLFQELQGREHQFFYDQHCRWRLDLLFHLLMKLGCPQEHPQHSFPIVIKLLKNSSNRPYLLYKTAIFIEHQKPEIIPYLFCEKELAELGMLLLSEIKLSNFSVSYVERRELDLSMTSLKYELIQEAFTCLLNYGYLGQDNTEVAKAIGRILRDMVEQVFHRPYRYDKEEEQRKNIETTTYKAIWEQLLKYRPLNNVYGQFGREHPLYMHSIYEALFNTLKDENASPYRNEMYSPNLAYFELLIRLLEAFKNPVLFSNREFENANPAFLITKSDLIRQIHSSYLNLFNQRTINVRPDITSEIEEREITYRIDSFGIDRVNWNSYLSSLGSTEIEGFFNACNTAFDLSSFEDKWDVMLNNYVEGRKSLIRFHLQVLIYSYQNLEAYPNDSAQLRQSLEHHITRLFCSHFKLDIRNNRIDIFEKDGRAVIEDILELSNEFAETNRIQILDTIRNNSEMLDRILLAMNKLISEDDLRYIRQAITEDAVKGYLEGSHDRRDAQFLLVSAINNQELADVAKQIIDYIEEESKTAVYYQESSVQIFLYHIKLVLADRMNDKEALDALSLPGGQLFISSEDREKEEDRKLFFQVRWYWRNADITQALDLAEQIAIRKKGNGDIIFLRFELQVESAQKAHADDVILRNKAIKHALELFEKEESPSYYHTPQVSILYRKLEVYHMLGWGEQFDSMWFLVKKRDRYLSEFATLRVDNCIERNRWIEASELVNSLKDFHQYRSSTMPAFIDVLVKKLSEKGDFTKHLKDAYKSILTLTPEDRIKALPPVISNFVNDYGRFLLSEICVAGISLQLKLFSLLKVRDKLKYFDEDNLTDLFESVLNARLGMIGLHWECQRRGGKTNMTNALSRSDLSTRTPNTLRVVEAVRIYPYKTLKSSLKNLSAHILKAFDQTPTRKDIYCLVYYQANAFESDWNNFLGETDKIKFPERFKLLETAKEIKECSTSDVKTAYTQHLSGLTYYYIFINLRYPTNSKPSK